MDYLKEIAKLAEESADKEIKDLIDDLQELTEVRLGGWVSGKNLQQRIINLFREEHSSYGSIFSRHRINHAEKLFRGLRDKRESL